MGTIEPNKKFDSRDFDPRGSSSVRPTYVSILLDPWLECTLTGFPSHLGNFHGSPNTEGFFFGGTRSDTEHLTEVRLQYCVRDGGSRPPETSENKFTPPRSIAFIIASTDTPP
jgi:hypothetical protein